MKSTKREKIKSEKKKKDSKSKIKSKPKIPKKHVVYQKTDGKAKPIKLNVHRKFLLFRYFNHSLPPASSPLIQTEIEDDEMNIVYSCVLFSYLAYKDRKKVVIPPNIGMIFERDASEVGKIPFFIVKDIVLNIILLTCRGSSCLDDFITDSMGNGISYNGGKIHQGVYNTASYVFNESRDIICDLHKENPEFKIIITGHSLGAAVAAVVTEMYHFTFTSPQINKDMGIKCICFAPPPTMSFPLWQISGRRVKSFMIEGDFVPFLSVQNILNFSEILFPKNANKFINKFVHKYLKNKAATAEYQVENAEKLYPPGQIYLIRFLNEHSHKVQLCQVFNPDYFTTFVKNFQETNHKCKNYLKVILKIQYAQRKMKVD